MDEDNNVASVAVEFEAPAAVAGRHLFYNNSYFDGDDPAATESDDLVVAPDKTALMPGQEVSSANVSHFVHGINGIMVDVAGLRGTPTIDDFRFSVGPSHDAARFRMAPDPISITVRQGAGVNGSDRVSIIWKDKEDGKDEIIAGQWLRVEVLPTRTTGLDRVDTFYFGHEVLATASPQATAVNLLSAVVDSGTGQPEHDVNEDGRVDLLDVFHLRDVFRLTPGDADGDGDVDFMDFVALSENFEGTTACWSTGDFNSDGVVDFRDFVLLSENFGVDAVDAAFAAGLME